MMNSIPSMLALAGLLGLASCATSSHTQPRRQAFPELQSHIEQQEKAGHKVVYPKLRKAKLPAFPDTNNNGSVWAVMQVGPKGSVEEVRIVGDTPQEHRQAIHKALPHWCFTPGLIDGQPATFPVQVNLSLNRRAPTLASQISAPPLPEVPPLPANLDTSYSRVRDQWQVYKKQGRQTKGPVPSGRIVFPTMPKPIARGVVRATFIVNERGLTEDIHVYGDSAEKFRPSVEAAVRKWMFKPALVDGKPHPSALEVPIRFEVRPSQPPPVILFD